MGATGIAIYSAIIQSLAVLALVCLVGFVFMTPLSLTSGGGRRLGRMFSGPMEPYRWALAIATTAMLGSLYLSEIVGFVPCRLCWVQRGFMYPMVPILAVCVFRRLTGGWKLVLPISLIGAGVSALHIFEQFNPEMALVPCGSGVPCSARYVAVFGWISIPVLAGSAFLAIAGLMLVAQRLARIEAEGQEPA